MDSGKRDVLIKAAVCAILSLLFAAAETSLWPYLRLFDAVPRLLFFFAAAQAVYEGSVFGLFSGAFAGFLMDGAGQSGVYYTIYLMLACAAIGELSPSFFRKRRITAAGWGAAAMFFGEFLRFFFGYYISGKAGISAVWTVIFPELFYSLLLSLLPIWPVYALNSRLRRETRLFR